MTERKDKLLVSWEDYNNIARESILNFEVNIYLKLHIKRKKLLYKETAGNCIGCIVSIDFIKKQKGTIIYASGVALKCE